MQWEAKKGDFVVVEKASPKGLFSGYSVVSIYSEITRTLLCVHETFSRFFKKIQLRTNPHSDPSEIQRPDMKHLHLQKTSMVLDQSKGEFDVPQNMYLHQGLWTTFARYYAGLYNCGKCIKLDIISGPIFRKDSPAPEFGPEIYRSESTVLQDGQVVPHKFFKIIVCTQREKGSILRNLLDWQLPKNQIYAAGFVFNNRKEDFKERQLLQLVRPISEIEQITGLKFELPEYKPLHFIQYEGLKKTKAEIDQEYFNRSFSQQSTIHGWLAVKLRAKQQKIPLQSLDPTMSVKFSAAAIEQLHKIQTSQWSPCLKLQNTILLQNDLKELDQSSSLPKQLLTIRSKHLDSCLRNRDEDVILKIQNQLQRRQIVLQQGQPLLSMIN